MPCSRTCRRDIVSRERKSMRAGQRWLKSLDDAQLDLSAETLVEIQARIALTRQ